MEITAGHISLVLGIIAVAFTALNYFRKEYKSNDFTELRDDVRELQVKIGLYWKSIEDQTSKMLHSPHRPILDRLLEKNGTVGLTQDEAMRLVNLLQKLIDTEELSSAERASALMLMAVTTAKYKLSC